MSMILPAKNMSETRNAIFVSGIKHLLPSSSPGVVAMLPSVSATGKRLSSVHAEEPLLAVFRFGYCVCVTTTLSSRTKSGTSSCSLAMISFQTSSLRALTTRPPEASAFLSCWVFCKLMITSWPPDTFSGMSLYVLVACNDAY